MILLDTNVIIDLLNNEEDARWNYLSQEDCVICGIVISELYSGIRGKKEAKAIELFINSVDCLQIEQSDWLEIGSFIWNLKKNGLSVPFQDSVLAYLSIKNKCKILTNDKHFSMMKIIEPRIEILWFCKSFI